MTRVTYVPPTETVVQQPHRSPLTTPLKAAGIIAACSWVLALLAMLLIHSIADPYRTITWLAVRESFVYASVFAVVLGSALAARWAWQLIRRPGRLADDERKRRWKYEDEDRKQARVIGSQLTNQPQQKQIDGARVHLVAFLILQRHAAGLDVTRDGCTPTICTQAEWNHANEAFKTIGLKDRYTLTAAPDLNESWPQWVTSTYLDNKGHLWAKPAAGGKHKLIA